MAEITPVQMSANGAITFEKTEVLPDAPPIKSVGKSHCKGHQCNDQVMLSRPMRRAKKKTYFTKPPTSQQIEARQREEDRKKVQ